MSTIDAVLLRRAGGAPTEELSTRVLAWCRAMGVRPEGRYAHCRMPTSAELRGVCRGPMEPVWEHLLTHVHAPHVVKHVIANLQVNDRLRSTRAVPSHGRKGTAIEAGDERSVEELEELQRRKEVVTRLRALRRERAQVEAEVSQGSALAKDVHAIKAQLASQSIEQNRRDAATRERAARDVIEKAFLKKVDDDRQLLAEIAKRLRKCSESPTLRGFEKGAAVEVDTDARQHIKDCLHEMTSAVMRSDSKDDSVAKATLRSLQREMLGVQRLLRVLHALSKDASSALGDTLLTQSAEEGPLEGDTGRDDAAILEGQKQCTEMRRVLLMQERTRQVERYFSALEHINSAVALEQQISSRVAQLNAQKEGTVHGNEVLKLQQAEAALAGERAALQFLEGALRELEQQLAAKKQSISKALEARKEIDEMTLKIERNRNLILTHTRRNLSTLASIVEYKEKLRYFARAEVLPASAASATHLRAVREAPQAELEWFQRLALDRVVRSDGVLDPLLLLRAPDRAAGSVPSALLCASRALHGQPHPVAAAYSALDVPAYACPSLLLRALSTVLAKRSMKESELLNSRHTLSTIFSESTEHWTEADTRETQQKVERYKAEMAALAAKLHEMEAQVNASRADCSSLRVLLDDWWRQPAKHTVPSVTVGGKNFDQWLEDYRTARFLLEQQ